MSAKAILGIEIISAIQCIVANYYDLKMSDIIGPRRTAQIAWARQVAMFLAYQRTGLGQTIIGAAFNRHRDTVQWARETVEKLCSVDPKLAAQVKYLEAAL